MTLTSKILRSAARKLQGRGRITWFTAGLTLNFRIKTRFLPPSASQVRYKQVTEVSLQTVGSF